MIIATFGPTTGWAGKTITREGEVFTLEDHGPISAADVMEYDRQGHLVWANDGTRAWVGAKASRSSVPMTPGASSGRPLATSSTPDRHRVPLLAALSQHLLLAIVLAVAVVVVVAVLAVSGIFGGDESTNGSVPQPVAAQSATAKAATPAGQTVSWPNKLAGTWASAFGTEPAKIIIAEAGGRATLTKVAIDGRTTSWNFAGNTLSDSGEGAVFGVLVRQGPSTEPFTGPYSQNTGSSTFTIRVGFSENTLTMSTNISNQDITEAYRLSPDGQTLTHYDSGRAVTIDFARQ